MSRTTATSLLTTAALVCCAPTAAIMASEPAKLGCGPKHEITINSWRTWHEITRTPIISHGHNGRWVRIFANDLAKDTYLTLSTPFPTCAAIVKPTYADKNKTKAEKLTIMVKMPEGYDPKNGDWWYALSLDAGTTLFESGKMEECIACHKQAAETDYMFSADVMQAVEGKADR